MSKVILIGTKCTWKVQIMTQVSQIPPFLIRIHLNLTMQNMLSKVQTGCLSYKPKGNAYMYIHRT